MKIGGVDSRVRMNLHVPTFFRTANNEYVEQYGLWIKNGLRLNYARNITSARAWLK